jgi:hypothetical protein
VRTSWNSIWFPTIRFPGLVRIRTGLAVAATEPRFQLGGAAIVAAITVVLIFAGYAGRGILLNEYDDSYITLRYARNLATGHGLVFNVGDATDSASSFLYAVLLAFCHVLGLRDLPLVATVLGVASAACTAAAVFMACLLRTKRPSLCLVIALAAGCHGFLSGWAISGMETTFFAALVTISVYSV